MRWGRVFAVALFFGSSLAVPSCVEVTTPKGAVPANCPSGTTNCNGRCVDIGTDVKHCGACGTACPGGLVCSEGVCEISCAKGTTDCGGSCLNLDWTNQSCGECGNACPPGELCAECAPAD